MTEFKAPSDKSMMEVRAAWCDAVKLAAFSLRVWAEVGPVQWTPEVGHYFCMAWYGKELHRVIFADEKQNLIVTEMVVDDAGVIQDEMRPPSTRHDWNTFRYSKHSYSRLPIPTWAWDKIVWRNELAMEGTRAHNQYLEALAAGRKKPT